MDTVIHVGAGYGSELDAYRKFDARRIVLIEPNPQLANLLQTKTRELEQIQVKQVAVAAESGESVLHILSNSRESSLLQPEKILKFFPNLACTQEERITCDKLENIVNLDELLESGNNLLVLETQGKEGNIIEDIKPEFLHRFKWIVIRASNEVLFENGSSANALKNLLDEKSFDLVSTDMLTPPYCEQIYQRNTTYIQIALLKNQLEKCNREIATLTQSRDEQAKLVQERGEQIERLKKARDEQAKLAQERAGQVEQLTKARDEQVKLAQEQVGEIDQLKRTRDEQMQLANERQAQLEQLTRAWEEQTKLAQERAGQVEQLTKARDEQARLAQERVSQVEQLTKDRDEQTKLANERQAQIERLIRARDEQAGLAQERAGQIEQLTRARDEQTKLANERQAQIEQLKNTRDEQAKQIQEQEKQLQQRTKERDQQAALVEEHKARIQELTRVHDEQDFREKLLDEEILKAEAQIELIKDVLLNEKAL